MKLYNIFNKINKKLIIGNLCLFVIIVITIIIRSKILFNTSLIPGTNGAYYLIQTRSIIEKLQLFEHDMPLIFLLQAGFSIIVKFFTHMDLENSIFISVKIFDSIVPALSAIPTYFITTYLNKNKNFVLPTIASLVIVTLSFGPLRMIGDFQKNALGMLWFLCMAYFLIKAYSLNSKRDFILSLIFLIFCGLTHIGAFGVALVFIVLSIITSILFTSKFTKKTLISLGLTLLGIIGLLTFLKYTSDSTRISKLISYIEMPISILQFTNLNRIFMLENINVIILFGSISIITIFLLIWKRNSFEKWEHSLIIPSIILTLFLICPFVKQDFSTRFQIMAFAPAAITLIFFFKHNNDLVNSFAMILIVIAIIIGIKPVMLTVSTPSISEDSYSELTALNSYIDEPNETVIIARHGLEWWVAWVLHIDIAQPSVVTNNIWNNYKNVLYIQEISMGKGFDFQDSQSRQLPGPGYYSTPPSFDQYKPPDPPDQIYENLLPPNKSLPQNPNGSFPQNHFFDSLLTNSTKTTLFNGNYFILYNLPDTITSPDENENIYKE